MMDCRIARVVTLAFTVAHRHKQIHTHTRKHIYTHTKTVALK